MENQDNQPEKEVGEMHKRRETMADGKRYIIYYAFGDKNGDKNVNKKTAPPKKESENV